MVDVDRLMRQTAPVSRRLALAVFAVLGVLAAVASPASAQYQPGQPGFILDPPIVEPGQTASVIGNGCPRGSSIGIAVGDVAAATTTASDDETGSFLAQFVAPTDTGDFVVSVTCGTTVMTQLLTVTTNACGFAITGVSGSDVTASVPGFQVGSPYTLVFASTPVQVGAGTIASDPQTVNFTIPLAAVPGAHTLTITGTSTAGLPRTLNCPSTVLASAATTAGTLPTTGSDASLLAQVAVGLLALGGGLVLVTRRRTARAG